MSMRNLKEIICFFLLTVLLMACHKNTEDEFTTVTSNELRSLFSFDTQKDVYDNLQMITSFNKEKKYHINGKIIEIHKCTPDNIDASKGQFSLIVAGTANHTPFQETLDFNGFKIKTPDEDHDGENGKSNNSQEMNDSITSEELMGIFIFDKSQTVTVALTGLDQFNGEKHINGKSVLIENITIMQQDPQSATFTLLVTGKVNGTKEFQQTLYFDGFTPEDKEESVNKPTDYNMAKRASVQIAPGKNIYEPNFDAFYREKKADAFAVQLKDFITISSSNNDGIPYTYSREDMQNSSLTDFRYDNGEKKLYFKVKYKSLTSPEVYIPFDHNEYYKFFVSVNDLETGKYYQSGVLHYLEETGDGGYLFNRFLTARPGFLVQYRSAMAVGQDISYSVKLLSSDYQELAQFDIVTSKFKDLKNLKNELIITGGEYSDFIRERLKDNVDLGELVKRTFTQNINKLRFSINSTSVSYSPNLHSLYSDTDKSLYFNNVILEYQSIVKERDGSITLNTRLSSVNGKIMDIIVPVTRFLLSSDLEKQ